MKQLRKPETTRKNHSARKGAAAAPPLLVVAENDSRSCERTMVATVRRIQMGAALDPRDQVNLQFFLEMSEAFDLLRAAGKRNALKVVNGGRAQ